jgi:flavin reductase (DIM6/NTAB) family NADH-FMN oxidoreductase RutF
MVQSMPSQINGELLVLNEEFKTAVGKFPTGVTVISTSLDNRLWGFTANSFTSVSLDPKLVSFCLNKEAGCFDIFKEAPYFAISILSSKQADLSRHFASRLDKKYDSIDYMIGEFSKAPLLTDSVAFIECKKYNQFECGDHYIFIGEVGKTSIDNSKSPLLYFAKSYLEIK